MEVLCQKMNKDSSEVKSTDRRQHLADNSTEQTDANSTIDEGMVPDTVEAINTTSLMVTYPDASRECVIQDHPISSTCVPIETSLKQWRQLADLKLHKVGHNAVPLRNFPKAHRAIQQRLGGTKQKRYTIWLCKRSTQRRQERCSHWFITSPAHGNQAAAEVARLLKPGETTHQPAPTLNIAGITNKLAPEPV
ncbi:unnamed protein product [Echinostoma caproni]|uniref:TSL-kinase interacting protein 1-like n=1 Tax=Echinostoma caproni TaxID=27848 RepID=A0A183B1L6_9TREM|nr:unnamed protein product [Echinostoma caproni]